MLSTGQWDPRWNFRQRPDADFSRMGLVLLCSSLQELNQLCKATSLDGKMPWLLQVYPRLLLRASRRVLPLQCCADLGDRLYCLLPQRNPSDDGIFKITLHRYSVDRVSCSDDETECFILGLARRWTRHLLNWGLCFVNVD